MLIKATEGEAGRDSKTPEGTKDKKSSSGTQSSSVLTAGSHAHRWKAPSPGPGARGFLPGDGHPQTRACSRSRTWPGARLGLALLRSERWRSSERGAVGTRRPAPLLHPAQRKLGRICKGFSFAPLA